MRSSPRSLPGRRGATLLLALTLWSSPAAAQRGPAVEPAWAAGGVLLLGSALLLDEEIRATATRHGGVAWDPLADRLNPLGNPRYLVPFMVAGWAGGTLAGRPRLAASSAHLLAALAGAGVANGTLKAVVGRQRPVGGDPRSFRPFNLDNRWQSFPSGHTVVVFSAASALATEADRPWVSAASYGAAALVGWSRVYEDKHWASDVVGGALVGVLAGRLTLAGVHRLHPHDGESAPVGLLLDRHGVGLSIPAR